MKSGDGPCRDGCSACHERCSNVGSAFSVWMALASPFATCGLVQKAKRCCTGDGLNSDCVNDELLLMSDG